MAFTFQASANYDAQTHNRETLPPGWYTATVLSAAEKYSRASGSPMIELTLGIDTGAHRPYELRSWLVLTTTAAWKIEQFLAAIGKRFSAGARLEISAPMCEGARLCVTVGARLSDRGNVFPEILDFRRREDCPHMGAMTADELSQWGLQPDGTPRPKAERDAEAHRQCSQLLSDAGLAADAPAGGYGVARAQKPVPMPHEEDDEIPF